MHHEAQLFGRFEGVVDHVEQRTLHNHLPKQALWLHNTFKIPTALSLLFT